MALTNNFEHDRPDTGYKIYGPNLWRRPQDAKPQPVFHQPDMGTPALILELLKVKSQLQQETARRKQAEKKLRTRRSQVRALASKLQSSEEQLRHRLAQDLHDTVAQCLAGCRLKLETLQSDVSADFRPVLVDECVGFMDQAIKQTRLLMFECYPWILDESGIEASLRSLAHRVQEVHGIQVACHGDGSTGSLSRDLSVLLFRTVRELLINVVKHAQAKHATISIGAADNQIRICVQDDGIGFNTTDLSEKGDENSGFGLASIRERIGELGGRLDFASLPGQGTSVSVTIPAERNPV